MLMIVSNPILGLVFFTLLVVAIKQGRNKYGIFLTYKGYKRLMDKCGNNLFVIDISSSGKGSLSSDKLDYLRDPSNINKTHKVLVIHDSDLVLKQFFDTLGLDKFSDHIYQTNVIDHNLKQFTLAA